MGRFLLYGLICYAALVVFVFLFQRRLLYYPDSEAPSPKQLQAVGLRAWPGEGSLLRGYVSSETVGDDSRIGRAGTVVVFHGNAGSAWHREYYVEALGRLGYRVVLAEYPGYGGRSGKPGESAFIRDARDTARLVLDSFGGPLFLIGESLGCGVATGVVADSTLPVGGIALITPWDSLPHLAQTIYWFLPVRWLVRDRYDNVENLAEYSGRVAVVVADQDEIIPKRLGLKLFGALHEPRKEWILEGAGHNTWMDRVDSVWWNELMSFVAG